MTITQLSNNSGLFWFDRELGISLSFLKTMLPEALIESHKSLIEKAFSEMRALERGGIANPDESRMVGHYWLRAPERAPTPENQREIESTFKRVKEFAGAIHEGQLLGGLGESFTDLVLVGIGGSALGPQFVSNALYGLSPRGLTIHFGDNTDPDGFERLLSGLPRLDRTLVLVISKSGGTKETRNAQMVIADGYRRNGLHFPSHAVAITCEGSALDNQAEREKWLARFPLWDWVGGRTSEFSPVGLLPAALEGISVDQFLGGARDMDELTRGTQASENPAMLLALAWYYLGNGKGDRNMVVLPYKDRLELFSRYLQQLVMESLGKKHDLDGNVVHQGLSVFGNKGSTDQHAFVQQLRDGRNDFFLVFVDALGDYLFDSSPKWGSDMEVEEGFTSGDYLAGFRLGTQAALFDAQRPSISITVDLVSPKTVGALIALFERTVGFYASLVNINAYHQPGVEAGKKAATEMLQLQGRIVEFLKEKEVSFTADEVAAGLGESERGEEVLFLLRRLHATGRLRLEAGKKLYLDRFSSL